MRKILAILCAALLSFIFVIAFYATHVTLYYKTLFTEKTAITLVCYDDTTEANILEEIENIRCAYNIEFSKYVFLDKDNISIFTTDFSAYDSSLQNGYQEVRLPMNNQHIRLFPIEELAKATGVSGIYYVHTTDSAIMDAVLSRFNHAVGQTEIFAVYGTYPTTTSSLLQEPKVYLPVLALLVISSLIAIFVIIKIAIAESKHIVILQVNGYSTQRIMQEIGRHYSLSFLAGYLLSMVTVVAVVATKGYWQDLWICVAISLLLLIALIAVCATVFLLAIKIIGHRKRKTDMIKGKTVASFLVVQQLLLKYVMLTFAALLFASLFNISAELDTYMSSNSSWFQTENVHRIKAKFITNDLAEKRKLELKAPGLYHALESDHDAFLMRSGSFDRLSSGQLVWEANAEKHLYSSSGKSITVNTSYLVRHPVLDTSGQNVIPQLILEANVRNILVPASLKGDEAQVYAGFLADFKHQVVDVPQIYARDIGENPPVIDESQLRINIIYVPDNLGYFSYDKDIMPETGNLIYDPIVVVDTENFDPSFYYAWLTSSVFFESSSPEAFSTISPIILQHELLSAFNTVEAIYDTRADEIQELAQTKSITGFVMVTVLILMVFFIYLLSHSYFEHNKYSIFVKCFSGYSLTRICMAKLLFELVLDALVLTLCGSVTIALVFIAIDMVLTYSFCYRLYKVSAQKALKGGLAS